MLAGDCTCFFNTSICVHIKFNKQRKLIKWLDELTIQSPLPSVAIQEKGIYKLPDLIPVKIGSFLETAHQSPLTGYRLGQLSVSETMTQEIHKIVWATRWIIDCNHKEVRLLPIHIILNSWSRWALFKSDNDAPSYKNLKVWYRPTIIIELFMQYGRLPAKKNYLCQLWSSIVIFRADNQVSS